MSVRSPLAIGLTIAAASAGVLALGAGSAAAAQVNCGDTITADTVLEADLIDCPDNGIVIGADGITLDLNGHTLGGNDELIADCPRDQFCDVGVVNEGHSGVTVRGGRVTEFATGVIDLEGRRTLLSKLNASHSHFNGILFIASTRGRLIHSVVKRNGLETDFPGIAVVAGSTRILVAHNASKGNADLGLWLTESDRNRIVGNDFSNNPEAGILADGDGNEFARNRVNGNGDGIVVGGDENEIVHNRISRSLGFGRCRCGNGISLEVGHGNLIARNEIRGATETGIRVLTFGRHGHLADTAVRHNSVHNVDGRGVLVGSGAKHTLLSGNNVRGSSGNGIGVSSASTRLTRNRANGNHGHGIFATPGVNDAGGNRAHGNDKRPQCVNVACG